MLHIPILRQGRPYGSVDKLPLVHHATGQSMAMVSYANSGMIVRDIHRMDAGILESFSMAELLEICRHAADLFLHASLPLEKTSDGEQSFEDYVSQLSATTGMPITYCRNNAAKIHKVLDEIDLVLRGLTRGLDLRILDKGYGELGSGGQRGVVSFFREGRIFGAVLPSNSPGVHSLWAPAIALKTPIVLKPGREEPWTPLRIIQAFIAAGIPREAFGFYPTDHAGAGELLRTVDRGMIFGDTTTTRPWQHDPRIEIHGPGFSKVILGPDTADQWPKYVDLMVSSIAANSGRSCINASAVWTPRHGKDIAHALAERLANIEAWPVDDPSAEVAAFADPNMAARISSVIDAGLREPGAVEMTQQLRGSSRLVQRGRIAWLLPTIIDCGPNRDHPLANREFLFPYASVIECPADEIADAIGQTLIASAITSDPSFVRSLTQSPQIDRLNIGPVPTWKISWDQPHEGNLFELLYRQRAFQAEALT